MASKVKETITHADPATIVRNKQVRIERNEKADKELLASVKKHGVLTPVQARMVNGKLHLIAGHRRTEAAIAAGLKSIPVYVTEVADSEILARQMIENIQREGLSLNDTAKGVKALHEGPGGGLASYTAERLGKSAGWVSKMLLVAGGDKVEGEGNIARKLIAADKIGDLESAYLLCKLEELNPEAAQAVADNIENETRASIKKKLQTTKRAKAPAGEEKTDEVDNGPALKWLRKVAKAATVSAKDLPLQEQALALIESLIAGD